MIYCYTYRQLTCRNLEVNSVSYVSQQKGSPWLTALEIIHNSSCLLEFSEGYGIQILMRLVPGPPGVELVGHSYSCDFCKSLLKTFLASNPPRLSVDENYPRS